jgi:multiple sugar transport system substrate-binding protein
LTSQVKLNSRCSNFILLYRRIVFIAVLFAALTASGCTGFNPADLTPQPVATATPDINPSPTSLPSPALPAFTPTPTITPSPTSEILVQTGDLRGIHLNFWIPQFEDWMPGTGSRVILELVEEFNQNNEWGIRIQMTAFDYYEDLYDAIQSAFQAEFPDLILGYTFQSTALERDVRPLADLDFYINDPIWGVPQSERDFYPAFWDGDVYDGKRVGMPVYRLGQVLYYNLTWGQALGFDGPPETPELFREQVCAASALVEGKPDGLGGWLVSSSAPSVLSWIYAYGGEVFQIGHRAYHFNNAQSEAAFSFVSDLNALGCAWQDRDRPPGEIFSERKALAVSGSLAGLPSVTAAMTAFGNDDLWTVLPFPSPDGHPGLTAYGPSISILETTEEKQLAAWLFIRWLVEPQNQARIVQVSGAFPTRLSAQEYLEDYGRMNPHWADAQLLLEYARPEPALQSWNLVRWIVNDAASFLFSPFFDPGEVNLLLEELDMTAAEVHHRRR